MHNINIWHPFPRRMDSVTNVYTFASSSLGHAQHLRHADTKQSSVLRIIPFIEGAIKIGQSRETGIIRYTRRRKTIKKKQHNMCWTPLYTNIIKKTKHKIKVNR
jgi:hypothetical protein